MQVMTVTGFRPPIWRRVLVPTSFDLAKLHRVIQEAFGWEDCHLHAFQIHGVDFGPPDPGGWMEYRSERVTLAKLDLQPKMKFRYEYDFGDSWENDQSRPTEPRSGLNAYVCPSDKSPDPPLSCPGAGLRLALGSSIR